MEPDLVAGLLSIQAGSRGDCKAVADYLRSLGGFDVGELVYEAPNGRHGGVWRCSLCLPVPGLFHAPSVLRLVEGGKRG